MASSENHAEETNRAHWDETAPVHLKSYQIDGLLKGVSRIDEIQKRELYPIKGKALIHLQCHIGTDTLSLAIDGAKVTGVDFSAKSIAIARELAAKMHISAEFLQANVLDLESVISTKYDIVYTSKGVLSWISNIEKWAETISFLLKKKVISKSSIHTSIRMSPFTLTMIIQTIRTTTIYQSTRLMNGCGQSPTL